MVCKWIKAFLTAPVMTKDDVVEHMINKKETCRGLYEERYGEFSTWEIDDKANAIFEYFINQAIEWIENGDLEAPIFYE